MEKERTKKFGDKRGTRSDSENEPTRVYRPRTLTPRKKPSWGDETSQQEKSESTSSDESSFSKPQEKRSFNKPDRPRKPFRDEGSSNEDKPRWRGSKFKDSRPTDKDNSQEWENKSNESSENHRRDDRKRDSFRRERDFSPRNRTESENKKPRFDEKRSFRRDDDKSYSRKPLYKSDRSDSRDEKRTDRKPFRSSERSSDVRRFDRSSSKDGSTRSWDRKRDDRSDRYRSNDRDKNYNSSRPSRFHDDEKPVRFKKSFSKELGDSYSEDKYQSKTRPRRDQHSDRITESYNEKPMIETESDGSIRLNKFVSNTGLCSRREADEYIQNGMITVNGEVINQLGTKIKVTDEVCFKGRKLDIERKVYILLNKPKDYVTTVDDPHAKRTVMDLIDGACAERVYPVGRLDRNSTGLLLLTNDGELTTRLTHPSFKKKKIYHVILDKPIVPNDLDKLTQGIEDEGEKLVADVVDYVEGTDGSEIGVEIHTGQNRVVRRMLNALGYNVVKLDRVYFAGLTKKNLPRGKWRFLTQKEINVLRMNRFE